MMERGSRGRKGGHHRHQPPKPKSNSNLIWGRNPIWEWLESGLPIKRIMLSPDARGHRVSDILKSAEQRHIPVKRLHPAKLDQMSGIEKHQNIIAEVELPPYAALEDVFIAAEQKHEPLLIGLLDSVQDPHNLGAILRSADATGVHGLIIPKDRAVGITPTVLKSSAGAAAWVPVVPVTNLSQTIEKLKDRGAWIFGASDDATTEYADSDLTGPLVIVLGNEGSGMRRILRQKCDVLLRIPMHGRLHSLNVSVAAALLFFEARRQRAR